MNNKTDINNKIEKIKDQKKNYALSSADSRKKKFKRVMNMGLKAVVLTAAFATIVVSLKRDAEKKTNQESYIPAPKWEKYRKYEDKIVAGIALVENFSDRPYLCGAGYWTIGYGNRKVNGEEVNSDTYHISRTFNSDFAAKIDTTKKSYENYREAMFLRGKEYVIAHLDSEIYPVIDENVKVSLSDNEMVAVAMFVYNVGSKSFANSEFLKALNDGERGLELAKKMTGFRAISKQNILGKNEKVLSKGLLKREWVMMNMFLNTPVESKDANGKKITKDFMLYLPQMIPARFYKEKDMSFYFYEEMGSVGENAYYTPKTNNATMAKFIENNTHATKNVGAILDKKTRESINKKQTLDSVFFFQKSKNFQK